MSSGVTLWGIKIDTCSVYLTHSLPLTILPNLAGRIPGHF